MTAMSVFGSVPTTLALSSRLSESRTRISSAFETTWLFVMMCPLASAITPDPTLRWRRSCGVSRRTSGGGGVLLGREGAGAEEGREPASVADRSGFFEEGVVVFLGGPAGEDHDAAPVEGRLHDVPDPLGQRLDRNLLGLVHLLRRRLL